MARTRGTTEAGVRRRAQILGEAEALVESVGFDDLKMETIAGSVGISKSTLYHYFPQKADMLFALHEQTMLRRIERQREIFASPLSVRERLRLSILDQLQLIAEHPGRVRVLMDSKRDNGRPHRKEMAKLERIYVDELVRLIELGIAEREIHAVDAELVAQAMLGMTQHARYWLRPGRPGGYYGIADEMWDLLVAGLSSRGADGPA